MGVYLTFSNRGEQSSQMLLDNTQLHAFYLMSTMFIHPISFPSNDEYEPNLG